MMILTLQMFLLFYAGLLVFCPERRPMNQSCMPWEDHLPHNLKVPSPS